ncbi:MAG: Fic family protein [Endomicrobium sp.]|jgi:Fic family protein|nr:Fic family protein [Endomicrobium sp.]
MKILDLKYYFEYEKKIGFSIPKFIYEYNFDDIYKTSIYQTQSAAVYSSNIEGNSLDLNSFMNYELHNKKNENKEVKEIENLIKAYDFAKDNNLNEKNFLKCHQMLSETLLIKSKRGEYRNEKIGVFSKQGLVYLAIEPEFVVKEMIALFDDILELLNKKLTESEVFYCASFIHLKFVHIHPFSDGNGRIARLLEKWFLSEKLGQNFWQIESEKYYKEYRNDYYQNINLGVNYYELNYDKCISFLMMLPKSLYRNIGE